MVKSPKIPTEIIDFPATMAIEKRRKPRRAAFPRGVHPALRNSVRSGSCGITEGIWERHPKFHHWNWSNTHLGMGQNLLLPYLEESTSINQLFEVPSGCLGFDSQPFGSLGFDDRKRGRFGKKVGFGTPDFEKKMKVKDTRCFSS